jgi:hypothetical protein
MGSEVLLAFDEFCRNFESSPFNGDETVFFGIPAGLDFFVPPLLLEKDSQEDPSVTLVSARGAAGKSTAAVQLAARLNAPLWRLERDKAVSGTSLEFVLGQYMGSHDVKGQLDLSRRSFLVIDSLDEAHTRVSGVSWTEFVESVGEIARCGLRCIMFGRERTLEDVWVTLCELDLSVAWWEISHFASLQCAEYVDGVVRRRDPVADLSTGEYKAARDALVAALRSAAEGVYADAFVGYPPVLDAVAAMLIKRPNLLAIRQDFENVGLLRAEGRIALLKDILAGLLTRDQFKIKPLAEELGLDPSLVYEPREQIRWLCHVLEGADPPDLAYIPDSGTRQNYVKQISTFAGDHPFRSENKWASPVFEAYVASVEFDSSVFSPTRLIEIGDTSGLLFDFVDVGSGLLITEEQFAALHASIIASEWAESMMSISIDQVADDSYEGTFAIKRGREVTRVTNFELIADVSGVLRIPGPLADLSVRSRDTVIVPGNAQCTVLGPDLFIHADDVRFEGPALEFARRPDTGTSVAAEPSVVIEARESLQLPPTSTQPPAGNEFELRVSRAIKLSYPWFEYRTELAGEENPNRKVIRFLNKLMNLTRSHGHSGERCTFIKKFEGRQPFPPAEFNAALGALVEANVVRIDNDMVFLRDEWEAHRYSGKALKGQRQLEDVKEAWAPVIKQIEQSIRGH